jgi:hypothetical protein
MLLGFRRPSQPIFVGAVLSALGNLRGRITGLTQRRAVKRLKSGVDLRMRISPSG